MSGWLRDRRWRRLVFVGVTLYAVFLITAPVEHHDLACHIKMSFHCTACASSHLGIDPHTPALPGSWSLADAGRPVALELQAIGILLANDSTGRSPPSVS